MGKFNNETFNKYIKLLSEDKKDILINYLTCYSIVESNIELKTKNYVTYDSVDKGNIGCSCCWIMVGSCWCGDIVILDTGEICVFYENIDDRMLYKIAGYEKDVLNEMVDFIDKDDCCNTKMIDSKWFEFLERV